MRNRQSIKKIRYFCFFFVGPGRAMLTAQAPLRRRSLSETFLICFSSDGFFLFGIFNQICFENATASKNWNVLEENFASIYSIPWWQNGKAGKSISLQESTEWWSAHSQALPDGWEDGKGGEMVKIEVNTELDGSEKGDGEWRWWDGKLRYTERVKLRTIQGFNVFFQWISSVTDQQCRVVK